MNAKRAISQLLFKEEQRFSQKWVWMVLLAFNGFLIFQASYFYTTHGYWEPTLLLTSLAVLGLSAAFASIKLETEISNKGISFRWLPFQRTPKVLSWKEIAEVRVVQYSPIADFGGWGIRFSADGTAAHNVDGDMGIKISIKGKRHSLLLGTQNPEKAKEALEAVSSKEEGA